MNPSWWASRARHGEPGRVSSSFVRTARAILGPAVRLWFRPSIEGLENLPKDGPYLLVANHSAGLAIAEVMSFALVYLDEVGADRPLAGFAHPFAFHVWPLSTILTRLGAVPSSYEAAEAALAKGVPLLVFPGGDHEAMRPIWRADEVDFNGRRGFLRVARKARVPIVPMGIRGSHATVPILWRSRLLPYLLVTPALAGAKRYGLSLAGAAGALALVLGTPWSWPVRAVAAIAWMGSPFAMLPWVPSTIRFRIGPPLSPDELFSDASDADLSRALEAVQERVQGLVRR